MPSKYAIYLPDAILGGQDGLVNVLGLTMGVASAVPNPSIVIVSGIAAMLAESISMAAVAYTSTKASLDYQKSQAEKSGMDRQKVNLVLERLEGHVDEGSMKFVRSRLLMHDGEDGHAKPHNKALVVGLATLAGSIVPLVPYLLLPLNSAIYASVILSAAVLFGTGALKAKWIGGSWSRNGAEMLIVGGIAAAAGYALGVMLHVQG